MSEKTVGVWLPNPGPDMVYIESSGTIVIATIGSNLRGFARLLPFTECKSQ